MRGTSVMPISALVLFLHQHRENIEITGDDLEEYRYIVENAVPPWLETILSPYRDKFVRGDARPWESGSIPGHSKPNATFCWIGHGDPLTPEDDKTMWNGANVGFHPVSQNFGEPDSGRVAISFKVAGENIFWTRRNFHHGDEFVSWVESVAVPQLERKLRETV